MAYGVLHLIFGCPRMPMAFPKPVDFEFPREKVLRLAEQQGGMNLRVPKIAIYLRMYLHASFHHTHTDINSYACIPRWSSMNKLA